MSQASKAKIEGARRQQTVKDSAGHTHSKPTPPSMQTVIKGGWTFKETYSGSIRPTTKREKTP